MVRAFRFPYEATSASLSFLLSRLTLHTSLEETFGTINPIMNCKRGLPPLRTVPHLNHIPSPPIRPAVQDVVNRGTTLKQLEPKLS